MIKALGNFFGMVMEIVGLRRERAAAQNAPDMKANAAAKSDQQIKDDAAKNIATGDIDQIRKDLAQ